MIGFAILLAFNLVGLLLQAIGVPLPANVLGLILFSVALFGGWVKLEWVEDSADFLLRHMLLFFAPAIAAVVTFGPLLHERWAAICGGMLASLLASMLVTGFVCRRLVATDARSEAN